MLNAPLLEDARLAGCLRETFVELTTPFHTNSKTLLGFWNERPTDGIVIGRDLPSRKIARLLSHIILWAPVDGGRDFVVRHMGETLRSRFGDYVVGQNMSALLSANMYAYYVDMYPRFTVEERAVVLDIIQSHNEVTLLHYEAVVLPAISPDTGETWYAIGTFYF